MTDVSSNRPREKCKQPTILGIWRLGEVIHKSSTTQLLLAQPADAVGSPRWDYVIKRAMSGPDQFEGSRQILQSIAAASRASHPNLVALLDASTTSSQPYLVMPRLEGEPMQSHLASVTQKPLPVALWLVRQLAQALDTLHSTGWVHGDVKPEILSWVLAGMSRLSISALPQESTRSQTITFAARPNTLHLKH